MRNPEFFSAVFGIIRNEKGEILFQKRKDTGYMDGWYQMPSGHLEGTETMEYALKRELEEEIHIKVTDSQICHIAHRVSKDRVYFDIYFEVLSYVGEIKNLEPDKCSELKWIDINDKEAISKVVPALLQIFDWIEKGIPFGEQE